MKNLRKTLGFKVVLCWVIFSFFTQIASADVVTTQEGNITTSVLNSDTSSEGEFDILDGYTHNVVGNGYNWLFTDTSGNASNISGTLNLHDVFFMLVNQMGINIGANGRITLMMPILS